MPKKILFTFAGTSVSASQVRDEQEQNNKFGDDVVRIYFNGCHDTRIGGMGGAVAPDINVVASRLRACFDRAGQFSVTELNKQFGSAVIIEGAGTESVLEQPRELHLSGFSRGAVTTFAAARHLNDLDIPISLFARDPVPGNSRAYAKKTSSEFYKNQNLSDCHNLRHAEVLLGVYSKQVGPLHNEYFRQMVPVFPVTCNTSIVTTPTPTHASSNPIGLNEQILYFQTQGLGPGVKGYKNASQSMFYVPKVLEQKFHEGVFGRTQLSTQYKMLLFNKLVESRPTLTMDLGVKEGQALYALDQLSDAPETKAALERLIKYDKSDASKALREFVVEFENINQNVLGDRKSKTSLAAMTTFRASVYQLIKNFPIQDATLEQKQALVSATLDCVKHLEGRVERKEYRQLMALMKDFLEDNILFHPDLTKHIDETETYYSKIITPEVTARATLDISRINNIDALEERLYGLSKRARASQYPEFSARLHEMIGDANQLGRILRFFSEAEVTKTLKNPAMDGLIRNADDFRCVRDKLATSTQRKILEERYPLLASTPIQKGISSEPKLVSDDQITADSSESTLSGVRVETPADDPILLSPTPTEMPLELASELSSEGREIEVMRPKETPVVPLEEEQVTSSAKTGPMRRRNPTVQSRLSKATAQESVAVVTVHSQQQMKLELSTRRDGLHVDPVEQVAPTTVSKT